MNTNKVWLVTGASKGLGLSLVKKLLKEGYKVVATSRNVDSLISEIGNKSGVFLPLEVNITDNENVKSAIERSVGYFGKIDVIVNNAGYGQIGTLEELTDEEARANFDVNVFGSLNIIRNVMPYLRKQGSGNIFNIASIGGFNGAFTGWGIYCATKFAMAGFTEGLAEEIKEFGVHATVVYPGYFRTDFLTKGSIKTPEKPIQEYKSARESERMHVQDMDGRQGNDPDKAADVLIEVSNAENPPVHLFLGNDAYDMVYNKINTVTRETEFWKSLTLSTAF